MRSNTKYQLWIHKVKQDEATYIVATNLDEDKIVFLTYEGDSYVCDIGALERRANKSAWDIIDI